MDLLRRPWVSGPPGVFGRGAVARAAVWRGPELARAARDYAALLRHLSRTLVLLELHVYLIGPDGKLEKDKDGKPHPYGVEMAGAAAVAEQGITAETMKAGTIVSVKVNPLRDGTD